MLGKAQRVLVEQGPAALARRGLAYSRRQLSLRFIRALGSVAPGSVVIPATAASHYVALAAFARSLPALNQKRREIQSKRVRTDAEVLRLFNNALFPSYGEPDYVRFHGWLSHVMGLDQRFASPPGT